MVERFEAEMTYTIDTVQDLVRVLDEHPQWLDALRARMLPLAAKVSLLAEEMRQFKAAAERRFDQQDQRLGRVESRLDRVIDDLGPLKGAHAGNVARREAGLIALDLGLRYRKSLTSMELVSLSDAVDTTGIAANELRSFHRADVIVEASDRGGELCYVAVEASYTVNGRDSSRAIRNAGLLTRFTGCRSYAVVAGLRRDDRIQDRVDAGEVFWCDTDTPAYGAGIVIRRPACSRTGRSRTPWRPSRVRRGAPVHLDGQQGDRSTARCSDRRSSAVGPLERGGGQTATV